MASPSRASSPSGAQPASAHAQAGREDERGADEETPLLVQDQRRNGDRDDDADTQTDARENRGSAVSSLLAQIRGFGKRKPGTPRRWPSMLALFVLCLVVVVILVAGFLTPEIVKDYAEQAAVFEPTSLSIDSFTPTGVVARVQGDFVLDAARVGKQSTRNWGRFATWICRGVATQQSSVTITLPEYDNLVLGTAEVPPVAVSIVNGRHTQVDILSELTPGPVDGIRRVANDFVDGSLGDVLVAASAQVGLKSGLFSIGTQTVNRLINIEAGKVPALPKYDVQKINVHEVQTPNQGRGLAAAVSVIVDNEYPVDFTVPPLGFSILAEGCAPSDPYIMLADATTDQMHVQPKHAIYLNATGFLQTLPEEFMTSCPNSRKSPFDVFVGHYLRGKPTKVYVKGSQAPDGKTPKWISDLISGITVPISVPNEKPDNLMKNFTMTNVHFSLPDMFAEPGTPEAQPKITADFKVLIGLPDEINFDVAVKQFKANSTILYKGRQLGRMDLPKWQKATSRKVSSPNSSHKDLQVSIHVEKVPVHITDEDTFQEVVQALLFGDSKLHMGIKAHVSVGMQTPLGEFEIRDIPAEGDVPVQPIKGRGSGLAPVGMKMDNLSIVDTTPDSMVITAAMSFTNPTNYSATIPYIDLNVMTNGTILGHGTVEDMHVVPGHNSGIQLRAVWKPSAVDGEKGAAVGRELLSQYISGYNCSMTVQPHPKSIPAQPALGRALEDLKVKIPLSDMMRPGKPGEDKPHMISDTTMHIWSSTATFVLHSPFKHTTMWLTSVNATAFHNDDVVGKILYDGSIIIPPGDTETPRLPVDWTLDGAGYDALKDALGGNLLLSAMAYSTVRIGQFEDRIWYHGRGIGAKIRL